MAVLIYHALKERQHNGARVRWPALLAVALTIILGWLDEGIQAFLPNRISDIRDVGFNTLAALMAVAASQVLTWARQWSSKFKSD